MHMLLGWRGRAWTVAALTVALCVIAGASAGVNTPQSGWYSGNPRLGPNNLTDLACAGSTCYAAGAFGTILKSTDAGATWSGIVTGLTLDMSRVRLAGSPERIVAGGGCSLRRSDDGGTTFQRLPFTASDTSCPAGVVAFSFPSSNVGYLTLSNGALLATADGGRTFSRRTAVPSGPARDLVCTSDSACFAVAGGSVQRSDDGGVSWRQVAQIGSPLNGLDVADADTLYAVGQNSSLVKSADGGATWRLMSATGIPPADFVSIRCAGPDTCLIAVRQGSRVVRTTDGGATVSSIVTPAESALAVEFASATRALAVGAVGSAEISDDGGETWRVVGGRLTDLFSILEAASGDVAYAGGPGGALARTVDGGQTWANVSPPTSVAIDSVAAPTPNRLFVLAVDGTLQRSDNGGNSYRLLNIGTPFGATDVIAPDLEHVLVIGRSGLRRSVDGGETFTAVSDRDLQRARLFGGDTAGSGMFAYGATRLLYSPNGGLSWRRLRLPKRAAIADVSFVSSQVGYLADRRGRLWRTASGGRRWIELESVGGPVAEVDFSDARNGFVNRGGSSFVDRTSDGGASWRPQIVSKATIAEVATAGSTAYALAGPNYLYATKSGGDVGSARTLQITTRGRVLSRPSSITVSGRLSAAVPGERVSVYVRSGVRWRTQTAPVAANGTFVTRWRVTGRSVFVAQIPANADHAGAGTRPLVVEVRKKRKR